MTHLKLYAKAYAALVGSLATAALGVYGPDNDPGHVLTLVVALSTVLAVWAAPRKGQA